MLGQPSHLRLRRQILDGEVLGPRLVTSGPSFNGRSVNSPQQATQMVIDQHALGYDFLKIRPGMDLQEFGAIAGMALDRPMLWFSAALPRTVRTSRAIGLSEDRGSAVRASTITLSWPASALATAASGNGRTML